MTIDQISQPITAQTVLEALTRAVERELDRKRRLGHYYVTWENGQAVFRGEDAPVSVGHTQKPQ